MTRLILQETLLESSNSATSVPSDEEALETSKSASLSVKEATNPEMFSNAKFVEGKNGNATYGEQGKVNGMSSMMNRKKKKTYFETHESNLRKSVVPHLQQARTVYQSHPRPPLRLRIELE